MTFRARYRIIFAVALLLSACSSSDHHAPPAAGSAGDTPLASPTAARCEDLATRVCTIELGQHAGLLDCRLGTQLCENGSWGNCRVDAGRSLLSVPAPPAAQADGSHIRTQAVGGTATNCIDNPCNPSCQVYDDAPVTAYKAPQVNAATGWLSGGTLASSNVPTAFKNKGSLNAQCAAPAGSQLWEEACQFDQHCVSGACVAYSAGDFGTCAGVDITAPTTCIPSTSGYRALTVCNRGTSPAPAGVRCYRYPGGSPQYPNNDPGPGTLVMTTAGTIEPGACETQQLPEASFGQNGIQSIACNPLESSVVSVSVGPTAAGNVATTSGTFGWNNPASGQIPDSVYASAAPANPTGASTSALNPTSNGTFGSDGSWTNPSNGYSNSPASLYATAAPSAPAASSGAIGPNYPGGFTNPAVSGDSAWASPDQIYAADSSYVTASPVNPTTPVTVSANSSANDGSPSWSGLFYTYITNNLYGSATLNSAGTSDAYVSGFGFNLPANAIIDSLQLSVKWYVTVNSTRYTLTAQPTTGASNIPVGSPLSKSSPLTTDTTDSVTTNSAGLAAFTANDLTNANFRVRLRFDRANGNVANASGKVDSVNIVVAYHLPSTTASVMYRSFGLGSVPANAAVQLTAEVKWKSSAVNAYATLGMQVYSNVNAANQAAMGAEVVRSPAAANTAYVDSTATLTPAAADLSDTSFGIRLRVTRLAGAVNPDFTASIDYVRVTLTWSTGGTSNTSSVMLKNFGLTSTIPPNATITSVTTTAHWKLSTVNTHATLGLQAYSGAGANALGSEVTISSGPIVDTAATQTVSSGVTWADLSDANFSVRVRVSRDGSPIGNPNFTAYLDDVAVVVAWTAPSVTHGLTYSNFGFNALPSDATITQLKTDVIWKNSVLTNKAQFGLQAWLGAGSVAAGAETVSTSIGTTATTTTQTLTGLSLTPNDLIDGNFLVKLRLTRLTGSSNPDFNASVDSVRVTVTYTHTVTTSVTECNDSNNWTATKLNPSPDTCQDMATPVYVPFTVTRVFAATCPADTGPVWLDFGYTSQTPTNTKIEFRFRTFAPGADGSCTALPSITSGPAPFATASQTADPQVCSLLAPTSSCPVSLYSKLGGSPYADLKCLQMDAYGVPSGATTPSLFDWTTRYECVDNQ